MAEESARQAPGIPHPASPQGLALGSTSCSFSHAPAPATKRRHSWMPRPSLGMTQLWGYRGGFKICGTGEKAGSSFWTGPLGLDPGPARRGRNRFELPGRFPAGVLAMRDGRENAVDPGLPARTPGLECSNHIRIEPDRHRHFLDCRSWPAPRLLESGDDIGHDLGSRTQFRHQFRRNRRAGDRTPVGRGNFERFLPRTAHRTPISPSSPFADLCHGMYQGLYGNFQIRSGEGRTLNT